jgi:Holliday junction resolvasome RuvABC endonuclease subunit
VAALLSLDVGLSGCGWVVFEDGQPVACGTIVTEKDKRKTVRQSNDNAHRAAVLALGIKRVASGYAVMGIIGELPSGGAQSAKAMQHMALATGAVSATAACLGLPVEWTDPNSVKLAVCGFRSASKYGIMAAIRLKYPDFPWPKQKGVFEHIADAVGVYMAMESSNLVRMYGKAA